MRARLPLLGLSLLLVLSACGTAENPPTDDQGGVASSEAVIASTPTYAMYAEGVLTSGKPAVIFFANVGDPFTVKSEAILNRLYGTGAATVSTYRVNMGTETGMRLSFGVFVEDTFVLLDAQGKVKAKHVHPSENELRSIVGSK